MRFYALASAVGAAALFSASSLAAQGTCTTTPSCTVTNTASATVNTVARLTLDANTTDLGTPVEADFTAGFKDAVGPVATVISNAPWTVTVYRANSNSQYFASTSTYVTKPTSDLQWDVVAGGTTHNAGTSAALVFASNPTGAPTPTSSQATFYRTNWSFALDTPGTYTLVVNYTLSEP